MTMWRRVLPLARMGSACKRVPGRPSHSEHISNISSGSIVSFHTVDTNKMHDVQCIFGGIPNSLYARVGPFYLFAVLCSSSSCV